MSNDIKLSDFFGRYGDIHDPNIQAIITSKREFSELSSTSREEKPKDGGYYNHQIYVDRLIEMVDRVIVAHETGTGKSFLIGALGMSAFKRYRRGRGIKHVYVLVSGPTQKADMTNMLVCRSTGGVFLNEKITDAVNDKSARQAATNSIKQWFTIKTYKGFAKQLESLTDQQLRREYSDCEFILDEIHNFRINPDIDPYQYEPTDQKEFDKIMTYRNILRLGEVAERIKIAGLSATLTINYINEAGPIFNLVLPPDRRFPIGFNFSEKLGTEEGISEIEWYLRGHISYVRAFNTGAIPDPQGDPLPLNDDDVDPIKITNNFMSEKQTRAYINAWFLDIDKESGKILSGWRPNTRQAANGIFPDGSWGNEGFNRYIEKDEKNHWWKLNKELSMVFGNEDTLYEHSVKTYQLLQIIRETDGVISVYMHQSSGSGIIYVALALEKHGYSHFGETDSVFSSSGSRVSYCSNISSDRRIRSSFKKAPRTAVITDGTPSAQIPVILDLMYSYENKNGEYVKVFMFTDKAKEGISINHGKAHVQFAGVWRDTDQIQAGNRIFRTNSHEVLIAEEIDRLIRESGYSYEKAKAEATIKIPTYKLSSEPHITDEDGMHNIGSIDTLMYSYCDAKSRESKRLYRVIKMVATDCHIHKKRNVRETDVDYSSACDYMKCDYDCYSDKLTNQDGTELHDYSTYDIFYMNETIKKIKPNVIDYFKINGSGTATMIKDLILSSIDIEDEEINHDYREKYIIMVLSDLIANQTPVTDRFGYKVYISEDRGMYYTTHEYSHSNHRVSDRSLSFYGYNPVINKVEPYISVFNKMEESRMSPEIEKIRSIPYDSLNYRKIIFEQLNKYDTENQSKVIEDAIESMEKGEQSTYVKTILDIFSNVIFELREPKKMIEKTAKKSSSSSSSKIVPVGKFDNDDDNPIVYLHSLYTHVINLTKYSETADIYKANGRIRMFKETEGKWRDPNEYEKVVYALYIQEILKERRDQFDENYPVYGIIFNNGEIKFKDTTGESGKARHDGLKGTSWLGHNLVDIMWKLKIPLPSYVKNQLISIDSKEYAKNIDIKNMVKYLKKQVRTINTTNWSDEKIIYQFLWLRYIEQRKYKTEMVKIIQSFMESENLILYLGKRP